jgi:SAM-dependent methyltransferase
VEGRPQDDVRVELDTTVGILGARVQLPDHPVPLLEAPHPGLEAASRILSQAGPGPVLWLGSRVPDGTDLSELNAGFGDRQVVNVDIHRGANVDVVGDAHQLSRFFRPGTFAAAISASLLEHVAAPWLVAAELNRVLTHGAPVFHVVPTTWPEHAQPNDFWRFTAEGLALLFGPGTGFHVLDKGAFGFTRVHPEPSWRAGHLDMPTVAASSSCWVLARKTSEISPGTISWPYDPAVGERAAKVYPVEAVVGKVRGHE